LEFLDFTAAHGATIIDWHNQGEKDNGMRIYALAPSTIRGLLWRSIIRLHVIVTLSFLAFGLFLSLQVRPLNWTPILLIVAITALVYFLVLFYHFRRQMRFLYSVRLELDASGITLRQFQQETLRVARADVYAVKPGKDNLMVHTVNPHAWIELPYGLIGAGDEDLRDTLAVWTGVEKLPPRPQARNRVVFWLSVLAGLLILLYANSLIVAVPLGVFLLTFGMYVERRVGKTYDMGLQISRTYSLAFSFLIFLIVMKSCLLALYSLYR
jgi:hypothetical protein